MLPVHFEIDFFTKYVLEKNDTMKKMEVCLRKDSSDYCEPSLNFEFNGIQRLTPTGRGKGHCVSNFL